MKSFYPAPIGFAPGARPHTTLVASGAAMDDPSQSANQAAGRQDHAEQEKWRAKMMQGSMTGLVERNTKWDVEYEGKDAKGTLVRPFEPGFGDARKLPEKMMGETMAMAVARGMGRNLPHSGAGDGTHVFKTADDPERLRKLRLEERLRDAPPDVRSVSDKTFAEMTPQELQSWKDNERRRQHLDRLNRGFGKSPVMKNNKFDNATTYSRASPTKRSNVSPTSPVSPVPSVPRSRDKPLRAEGAHAMLDRMGPNILSGPIPRDGFTTDGARGGWRRACAPATPATPRRLMHCGA